MKEETKTVVLIGGANKKERALRLMNLGTKFGFHKDGSPISDKTNYVAFYYDTGDMYFSTVSDLEREVGGTNYRTTGIYFEENVGEKEIAQFRGAVIPVEQIEMTVAEISEIVSKAKGKKVEVKVKKG